MSNKEKYDEAFKSIFEIGEEALPGLQYQSIPAWDSIGHMGLINEIEEAFDISMETEDIVDFSSYEKGMELLKKYDVEL